MRLKNTKVLEDLNEDGRVFLVGKGMRQKDIVSNVWFDDVQFVPENNSERYSLEVSSRFVSDYLYSKKIPQINLLTAKRARVANCQTTAERLIYRMVISSPFPRGSVNSKEQSYLFNNGCFSSRCHS
ncbi:hypothetical protein AVEN_167968-1 [Araneus ventricosus]|uniref:Uncharacterized protein n=1 Tax=Araneus ventricosus TaxID=182803 RepID=A0A4Y2FIL7_ARAVE|nr:hypothetical protein AVEN_167968-1 [Araneus ventricosus]